MSSSPAMQDGRFFVIDASTPRVFAGLLENGSWQCLFESDHPPLESVFGLAHEVLRRGHPTARDGLSLLTGFIYCAGPGSVLGIRLTATAINSWVAAQSGPSQIYRYQSVHFAHLHTGKPCAVMLRRDTALLVQNLQQSEVLPLDALQGLHPLLAIVPTNHRIQDSLLAESVMTEYHLRHLPTLLARGLPLEHVTLADAIVPQHADFKRWTPDRHRRPADRPPFQPPP